MPRFVPLRSLWRNLVHRRRVGRDIDDEVRATFDLLEDEKRRSGLTPDAARRASRIDPLTALRHA